MRRFVTMVALMAGVLLSGNRAMVAAATDVKPSSIRTFSAVTLQISTNKQGVLTGAKLQGLGATYQVVTNGLPWDFIRFQGRIVDVQGEVSSVDDKLWVTIKGTVKINSEAEAKKKEEDGKRAEAKKKEEAQKKGAPAKDKKK